MLVPGNVMFVCLLIFKLEFCDSAMVIISGCSFLLEYTGGATAQNNEKYVHDLLLGPGPCGNHSLRSLSQGWEPPTACLLCQKALVPTHSESSLSVSITPTACSHHYFVFWGNSKFAATKEIPDLDPPCQ